MGRDNASGSGQQSRRPSGTGTVRAGARCYCRCLNHRSRCRGVRRPPSTIPVTFPETCLSSLSSLPGFLLQRGHRTRYVHTFVQARCLSQTAVFTVSFFCPPGLPPKDVSIVRKAARFRHPGGGSVFEVDTAVASKIAAAPSIAHRESRRPLFDSRL